MAMSDVVRRRVVKLGGSSMSADYAALLRRWLAVQPAVETIVVMGGGREISSVAKAQQLEEFDDAEAHWLCIEVMRQNAQNLIRQMPEAKWLPCCSELPSVGESTTLWIVDPWRFMLDDARTKTPLPESWDVSSDSIAARLAERIAADELVLLKSRLPQDLQRLGRYVDPLFTFAARNAPRVRFVNVRDPQFAEVRWNGAKR
jgi:5-(aminomethyl)-3-furanmethanol phosphate kinase